MGQKRLGGKAAAIIGISPGNHRNGFWRNSIYARFWGNLDVPTLRQPEAYVQFKEDLFAAMAPWRCEQRFLARLDGSLCRLDQKARRIIYKKRVKKFFCQDARYDVWLISLLPRHLDPRQFLEGKDHA